MRRRRISRIKRILRGVNRFIPTLQQPIAQHSFDETSRHLGEFQELRQRQRPSLCLQQFSDLLFFAYPQRTLRLCVIFFFALFFLAFFFLRFAGRRSTALPRDHALRSSLSSL